MTFAGQTPAANWAKYERLVRRWSGRSASDWCGHKTVPDGIATVRGFLIVDGSLCAVLDYGVAELRVVHFSKALPPLTQDPQAPASLRRRGSTGSPCIGGGVRVGSGPGRDTAFGERKLGRHSVSVEGSKCSPMIREAPPSRSERREG